MANLFKFAENILNNLDQSTQSSIQSALQKNNTTASSSSTKSSSRGLNGKSSKSSQNRPSYNNGSLNTDAAASNDSEEARATLMSSHSSASLVAASMANQSSGGGGFKSFSSSNSSSNLANSWNQKTNNNTNNNNKEDELIDFLNSSDFSQVFSEPALNFNSKASLEINTSNIDSSPPAPPSYNSEATYSPSGQQGEVQFSIGSNSGVGGGSGGENKSKHSDDDDTASIAESLNGSTATATTNSAVAVGGGGSDNEKTVLKAEVKSLNQEVQALMKRIKTIEEENQRSKRKVEQYQVQISQSDKIIRELRAREDDMNEALRSKDSQIAVIRVRFEELEGNLKSRETDLNAVRAESERLLKDHSNSSDLQSQLVETMKDKLAELETGLTREKEAYHNLQRENMNVQSKLEAEKQALIESLNSVEKRLNEEKHKSNELNSNFKNSKNTYNFLKQEFEEYKLKASKTLAAKDRLIATLKESATNSSSNENETEGDGNTRSGSLNLKSIEIDELRIERDSLKEELNAKNVALEMLRAEMMELESQSSVEIEHFKDQLRELQDSLDESKQSKEYLEQDLKSLRQQLEYAQEESYKQKTSVNSKIQEKEIEIEKLRSQLTTKSLSTTSEKELENRLHLLTENLIQKQTLIEALQSEKHSIFLQLERTEKRLQDYETILASKKSTSIRMHDDDDNSNRVSAYFRESPYDHRVTRRVKQAVSEIDKFSIRLGVFLKRYPIARIFVIFYMFLLHLWVGVVLFTYKPEVHDLMNFEHPPFAGANAVHPIGK